MNEESKQITLPADGEPALAPFETQSRLAQKFGITAEFIRVPMLSKMLGISSNAIYAQIRSGAFPMPHKRVGNVVVVRLIDFVDWYCAGGVEKTQTERDRRAPVPDDISNGKEDGASGKIDSALIMRSETAKERVDRIKHDVLASMRARCRTR